MKHLFDGYGMLVKFHIENGKVSVQQRFIESNAYKAFRDTGKMKYNEFGTSNPAWQTLPQIAAGLTGFGQGFTDNATVNVFPTKADGSELMAVTESVVGTYRVRTDDLGTLHQEHFQDNVKGDLTTAHPKIMPNGDLINLVVAFGDGYRVVRQPRGSSTRHEIAKIPLRHFPTASWIHDFTITDNYAIVPETPIEYNMAATLTLGSADYVMFDWKPQHGSRIHLVPLNGDNNQIKSFDAPAYFTFHYLNAFETADGKSVCFDFANFETPDVMAGLYLEEMRERKRPVAHSPLTRVTLPLDGTGDVKMERLMEDNSYVFSELPKINPNKLSKPYRYAYSVSAVKPTTFGNALAKFDLQERSYKQWYEPGCVPVEPLMVPAPNATAEDDGVVLSIVMGNDGWSFLLVLDAKNFTEVARVKLDWGIPYGFHASFCPAKDSS
jgi:carlactone synthase/all-trans-10'-apo-beta-carotenal 13,14-cleaving dioxygenase